MKPNLFRVLPVLLLTTFVLTGCKKDNVSKQPILLLAQEAWLPVFLGYDNNKDGLLAEDYTENALAECSFDDTYVFEMNGTFFIHANANTNGCGTDGGPFPWSLAANGIDFNYSGLKATIERLDEHNLRFYTMVNEEKCYFIFKH
jgi:hypothetical protein